MFWSIDLRGSVYCATNTHTQLDMSAAILAEAIAIRSFETDMVAELGGVHKSLTAPAT